MFRSSPVSIFLTRKGGFYERLIKENIRYSVTEDDVDGYTSKIVDMHKVLENEDDKDDNDDEEIEPYIMEGPEFDFVITNSHTPKPEPKPEAPSQKLSG